MKLKLLKISAFVVGVFPLLIETDCDGPAWSPSRPAAEYGSRPRPPAPRIHASLGGWRGVPRGGVPRPRTPPRAPIFPGQVCRMGGLAPNAPCEAARICLSRAPNISRPGPSRIGGLAPNGKLAGGGNNQLQLPSKIQSLPKGNGSVLPSIATEPQRQLLKVGRDRTAGQEIS